MARGRDLLFQVLKDLEIGYLFGNPGTSEMPIIDGCTEHPEVRYVQCLHEGIAVGMAMGYARATGKVGVANLHVAPGLAHGLSNMYTAHRAGIPIVVTAGQHHSQLLVQEPILAGPLVEMARPFTKWAFEVRYPGELPVALQRAFKEAMTPPTGPVFLSLPVDVMLMETDLQMPPVTRVGLRFRGDERELEKAARMLCEAQNPILISGDGVGQSGAWEEMAELAERLGAPVYTEGLSNLADFPSEHPHWLGPMAQNPPGMRATFEGVDLAFLCGFSSQAPTPLFDNGGPLIPPGVRLVYLHDNPAEIGKNYAGAAAILGDVKTSLGALNAALAKRAPAAETVAARTRATRERSRQRRARWLEQVAAAWDRTPISPLRVAAELASLLPHNATVSNESVSNNAVFVNLIPYRDPLSVWTGKSGGLGHSGPAALGMKVGAPHRTVVNVVGDGSFLYHPQVLWTATNMNLPVLFVVLNNRDYRILHQLTRAMGGPWAPSGATPSGLTIDSPAVDFVSLAGSFGVAAERVTAPGEVHAALKRGLSAGKPYLVEIVIE